MVEFIAFSVYKDKLFLLSFFVGCFWVSIYCSRTAWCNLRTTVEKSEARYLPKPNTRRRRRQHDLQDLPLPHYFQNKKGIFFSGNSYNCIFLAIDVAKGTSTFCWIMISLWRDYEEKPSHGTRNFVKTWSEGKFMASNFSRKMNFFQKMTKL